MSNQSNKEKLNMRVSRPITIGSAFGGLLKIFGGRASDADLAARWDAIMGAEISSVAKLCGIKKMRTGQFNVALRAVNPAFALQLSYMTAEITARINKYFGYDAVAKITIRK